MTATVRLEITPTAPFHLGNGPSLARTDRFVRSDTLGSALMATAARMGSEDWIQTVVEDSSFALSSLFPSLPEVGDLLPVPIHVPQQSTLQDRFPGWKSARWVQRELVAELLAGKLPLHEEQQEVQLQKGILHAEPNNLEDPKLPRVETRQKNTLDRRTDSAVPYKTGMVRFPEGSTLFGWIKGESESLSRVPDFLEQLSQFGVGGERSSGAGRFDFDPRDFSPSPEVSDREGPRLLVSLCWPTAEDVEAGRLEEARYRTTRRGGWIQSGGMNAGHRKRTLRMLNEGAVFDHHPGPLGAIPDVAPASFDEHPIWRLGRAFLY